MGSAERQRTYLAKSVLQRASLLTVLDLLLMKDDPDEVEMQDRQHSHQNMILVDASAWLAFVRPSHPEHNRMVNALLGADMAELATGDHVVTTLSQVANARDTSDRQALNHLVWLLWSSEAAKLLPSASEEDRAWSIYMSTSDSRVTFANCLTLALVKKYKITAVVHCDGILGQLLKHGTVVRRRQRVTKRRLTNGSLHGEK